MKFFFLIFFLLMIPFLSLAQENFEIKKIKISGQGKFHKSIIKENMTLEPTSWVKQKILKKESVPYSKELYNEDINRVIKEYQKIGYLKVSFAPPKIEIDKKQKITLHIHVDEGEPIKISSVNYTVDSTQTLTEALPIKEKRNILMLSELTESKVFSDKSFFNDQLLIAETFSNIGYPFAEVKYKLDVDSTTNVAAIEWLIHKNHLAHFGSTTIKGNLRVPNKTILKQLAYQPGDIWAKKKIDQTQKQIYNQGMYRVASVRSQLNVQQKDTLPVQIQIKEAPRWSTRFGAGYGREDRFRTFADLQFLGFLTNAGRLNVYGKHSGLEPYNFYLKFSQPSVFFPINTLSLYPYIQSANEPGYQLNKVGFNISMLQNFSKNLNTSVGLEYEDVKLDTLLVNLESFNQSPETYYKKAGIVLGGIYSTADPLLDPIQGHVLSLNIKTNGLSNTGAIPFFRILAEFKKYIGIQNGVILALKAKAGGINRTDGELYIPADERFYAGGNYSVRGWSRSDLGPKNEYGDPVGGRSLLEGSAEFRISISKIVVFSLFADAGNVWADSFNYHLNDLHYAAGTGIKVKTPIGPVGLDFARPIFDSGTQWQIHLNIGHSF